ncbi:MAG: cytidylate kinase-like family protein [Ruminococcaceae bacterium]|nr:cytidylate kinase-like family protein [Oscillospiraceae bacterium]
MANFTITIARGFGSGGRTIGRMLAERLGIAWYDQDLIKLASEESGINIALFDKADEYKKATLFGKYDGNFGNKLIPPDSGEFTSDDNLFNYQAKVIKGLHGKENCVIVGRCADYILREEPNVLRVFVYASKERCIKTVADLYNLSEKEAERQIDRIDRARSTYYRYYTGQEWDNARNYDLCLNSEVLGFERCVDLIEQYLKVLYSEKV